MQLAERDRVLMSDVNGAFDGLPLLLTAEGRARAPARAALLRRQAADMLGAPVAAIDAVLREMQARLDAMWAAGRRADRAPEWVRRGRARYAVV